MKSIKLYEENKESLEKLQNSIEYNFKNKNLLLESLTHKSYDKNKNNERLEFLGDAVLDLLIGEYVFKKLPKSCEGDLTKLRASMVNEASFAKLARAINLGDYLFISNAEEKNNGRDKSSILSNALEALIGAIYLDSNINNAKKISYALIEKVYKKLNPENLFKDYKTLLQELTQSICGLIPEYILIDSSGPDHNKIFTMKIIINNIEYATKNGKSKKEAEQACAKVAYEKLKIENKN
ncbi:MAG: ribonuclease III [Helicobacteraceae bacterium]|nr:ribonuclease III [Helicobacteraceae bacterium]